eukprot:1015842-Ditylum_brightwellii.AAC.1
MALFCTVNGNVDNAVSFGVDRLRPEDYLLLPQLALWKVQQRMAMAVQEGGQELEEELSQEVAQDVKQQWKDYQPM